MNRATYNPVAEAARDERPSILPKIESDPRDMALSNRIIFQGGEKPWAVVPYQYGSTPISSHKTIQDAREAMN